MPILTFHFDGNPDPDPDHTPSFTHVRKSESVQYQQGCGSGSGSVLDPYSIGSVDPDPYSEYGSGSGSRRAKMPHKSRQ